MAALPVMKLGTLLLQTLSKPIANRLKSRAAVHPKFRGFIISIAQMLLRYTSAICLHPKGRDVRDARAAAWRGGWWTDDADLLSDDPENAAIPALLDSRFDAHL
ncbi:hypothetical protein ZWY2020_039312 [Hordeum vulgare]|nr:hypothetical protein ZWY2020_039312 [Hordeum vulgare]